VFDNEQTLSLATANLGPVPSTRQVHAMPDSTVILGIPGSTREHSFSRAALVAAGALLPTGARLEIFDLWDLPSYDPRRPYGAVPRLLELKRLIRVADGVLFAAPEYLYGLLTVLDNALESASQPAGDNAWAGKPTAVIGISLSSSGLARAQQHLRWRLLGHAMCPVAQQSLLIGHANRAFDLNGHLRDARLRARVRGLMASLVEAGRTAQQLPTAQTGAVAVATTPFTHPAFHARRAAAGGHEVPAAQAQSVAWR
jgi:chromate reductase, NAD(P)H dehydrogenase (quinone)